MIEQQRTYAFIDSQNLNLGVRSVGWRIDYRKLRLYLKNKYGVSRAFMFIGLVTDNQSIYTMLQRAGFILVFKPTIRYSKDGNETVKGNVDAELVLHAAAIEYDNYDKAIIVSCDGDFYCLVEYLEQNNKLLTILVPNRHFSGLLRNYFNFVVRLDRLRDRLEFK